MAIFPKLDRVFLLLEDQSPSLRLAGANNVERVDEAWNPEQARQE